MKGLVTDTYDGTPFYGVITCSTDIVQGAGSVCVKHDGLSIRRVAAVVGYELVACSLVAGNRYRCIGMALEPPTLPDPAFEEPQAMVSFVEANFCVDKNRLFSHVLHLTATMIASIANFERPTIMLG